MTLTIIDNARKIFKCKYKYIYIHKINNNKKNNNNKIHEK